MCWNGSLCWLGCVKGWECVSGWNVLKDRTCENIMVSSVCCMQLCVSISLALLCTCRYADWDADSEHHGLPQMLHQWRALW